MADHLSFGVFPFGLSAGPDGVASGPPDDLGQIGKALARLQGSGPPLLVRTYVAWTGPHSTAATLQMIGQFLRQELAWDLVLAYRDPSGDIEAWCAFVRQVVVGYGHRLAAIQVTGEANLVGLPAAGDGDFPRACQALVRGVIAAGRAKQRNRATAAIGFAVVHEADPAAGSFWPSVARLIAERSDGTEFAASLDYAGIDMYPDVFGGPIALDHLDGAVGTVLRTFREQAVPMAGIDQSTPIRICENGWPTGPGRAEERQADVLETVLHAVARRQAELNVTHWQLFALRDADSSGASLFHRFGVLHDDYTPKPAFDRLCRIFAELG